VRFITSRLMPLPLWLALPLAAVGGILLGLAFPAVGIWPLALVGVFIMLWTLVGRRVWSSLLLGLVGGAFFWGPLIFWLTLYLGPVPWLGLAGVQTLWMVIVSGLIAVVLNRGPLIWPMLSQRLLFVPLIVAGLWVAREGIASVWPYGGFAWARVAQSQSESAYGQLVAWIGTAGLSFVIVWVAAFSLELVRTRNTLRLGGTVVIALILLAAIPRFPVASNETLRIAAVQGNTKSGLFDHVDPGQNVIDHTQTTLTYVKKPVDIVVWPENAADIDPMRDVYSALILNYLSKKFSAPFIVGTITHPTDGIFFNSSLVWEAGRGVVAQYDKIHPVPFAEYMPNRDFFHLLAPDLVDMVTHDYSFGTRSNVVNINGTQMGLSICFDIVDDQQIYDMMGSGAQVILAQTNNADFGYSAESVQQLAIAKLRAIESGRSVVNISTVGVSAIIRPDGSTQAMLPAHTRGAITENVALSTTTTSAMVIGRGVEVTAALIGLVGFVLCLSWRRSRSRDRGERAGS
jgi:apolipoprotein N-acyltransferase